MGDILRRYGPQFDRERRLTPEQGKAVRELAACRTAVLGGHKETCQDCGHEAISYNSCGNRHCPKCQWAAQERWIESRMERVLNTHYFHVVFTLPFELRPLAMVNPRVMYELLFRAANRSLRQLAKDPKWLGAEIGITSVLHTWSRTLDYHPHLHNIVTGGGLTPEGTWKSARGNFLVSMRVLAKLFRGKFVAGLRKLRAKGELSFTGPAAELEHPMVFEDVLNSLSQKQWNVYIKRPFAGPRQVIAYLGRYTHRVAISNSRLMSLENDRVTFRTRGNKTLTLPAVEFIRRFSLHVLPKRFVKIRHYGLHAARSINSKWQLAKALIGTPTKDPHEPDQAPEDSATAEPSPACPACGSHNLATTELLPQLPPRSPPSRAPPRIQLAA